MKKLKHTLYAILPLLLGAAMLVSCSESEEIDEYDNWKARNEQFLDSIAQVAKTNADGSWTILKGYNLGDSTQLYAGHKEYFVYVKKLKKGDGTTCPYYTDSIRVHYIGRLLPTKQHPEGLCFGKSYATNQFNEATDVPTLLAVKENITGFTTALMNMHEGDRWMVYIPYYLAYGKNYYAAGDIPGYSTLIFEMQLARIYRYKIDLDTSWH